mgnify:CR=1 FL=1
MKRKQQNGDDNVDTIGSQVRRLTDLYNVRFHYEQSHRDNAATSGITPTCPISGKALTGAIPAVLLVPGKDGKPNVCCESALLQLSPEELQEEFGQLEKKIRLAPPPTLLENIKKHVRQKHAEDEEHRKAKKAAKMKNKRKRNSCDINNKRTSDGSSPKKISTEVSNGSKSTILKNKSIPSLGQEVHSTIQRNKTLSSIFTSNNPSKISEKEKKDNLFAR